jgi:hypothetical protein
MGPIEATGTLLPSVAPFRQRASPVFSTGERFAAAKGRADQRVGLLKNFSLAGRLTEAEGVGGHLSLISVVSSFFIGETPSRLAGRGGTS